MAEKFCFSCGTKMSAESVFCPDCGANQTDSGAPVAAGQPVQPAVAAPQYNYQYLTAADIKQKKHTKKVLTIVGISMGSFLLVLGIILACVFGSGGSSSSGGNGSYNGGYTGGYSDSGYTGGYSNVGNRRCMACSGSSGVCRVCEGSGQIHSVPVGTYRTCTSCNGSGLCIACNGTGRY